MDYKRFESQSMLDCFKIERDAIRQHSRGVPITTNAGTPAVTRNRFGAGNAYYVNHTAEVAQVPLPADARYRDLLRAAPVTETVALAPHDVRILARLHSRGG